LQIPYHDQILLANRGKLKVLQQFIKFPQEFMREVSTLISPKEQKNVSEVSKPTRSFRSSDASQSSSLPLCQQFNKKERKEERKWE
jgi:hypothetical protein